MTGKHVASAVIILFLLLNSASVFAIQQLMAFQGKAQQNGRNVTSGDLQVLIYSASAGGTLVYDSGDDYNSTISGGYFDAMLGDQTDLDLNYGQFYYLDMRVDGVDLDFSGSERKQFYSSIGTNMDTNSHFVPYTGADYDTNLGTYGLTAEDINAINFGMTGGFSGFNAIGDANFVNIGLSGIVYGSNASLDLNIVNDVYLDNDLNVMGKIFSNEIFGTFYGDGSNLTGITTGEPLDTTLDTNATANTSWLNTTHNFTADQNFTSMQADRFFAFNALGDANVVNLGVSGTLYSLSPIIMTSDTNTALSTLYIGEEDEETIPGWTINAEVDDGDTTNLTIRTGAEYWFIMGPAAGGGTYSSMDIGGDSTDGIIRIVADELAPTNSVVETKLGTPDRIWKAVHTEDLNAAGDANIVNIGISGIIFGDNTNLDLNIASKAYFDNDINATNIGMTGGFSGFNAIGDANFMGNVAIAGTLFGASPVKIAGGLAVKGTTIVSGLVGIGTDIPSSELDVAGRISGTVKDFRITHPLNESMFLVHSTLEGPEIAVFYRGDSQLEDSAIAIELPEYFEALTRKEGRTVLLTSKNGWSPLYVDGDVENNAFTVRTTEGGNPSQEFFWEVKAVRADIAPLQAEVAKTPEQIQEAIERSWVFARHDEARLTSFGKS